MSAGSEHALSEPSHASPAAGATAPGARWADLRLRLASALVLAPLTLACLWWGGWAWATLTAVALCGVAWEWCRMCGRHRVGTLSAGLVVAALAAVALIWLRVGSADGLAVILFLLAVVWCSDIGAYLAGRLFGGKRLAPAISPGKTWSGAAGGLLAAVAGGLLLSPAAGGWLRTAVSAGLLGVVSQAGDLSESALKRHFGVKDSGRLIPGHGGVLDRLDGLIAVALVAAAWIVWTGRGDALWR